LTYFIYAPSYRHCSAGIRALYELQKWLIRSGEDAVVVNHPCSIEADDVAVYPETLWGDPLKARRVVRYILSRPGDLGGPPSFPESEILVGYNHLCAPYTGGHVLTVPVIESFFTDWGRERTVNCVYLGKTAEWIAGRDEPVCHFHPVTRGAIPIDRYNGYEYPHTRKDMAELLNRCRILYTYDDQTMLADEARLCGAKVKLIRGEEITDYPHPLPDFSKFPEQLQDFIRRTKA